jgi:hypothetical protein
MLAAVNVKVSYSRLRAILGFRQTGLPYSRIRLLQRVHPEIRVTLQQGTISHLVQAIIAMHGGGRFEDLEETMTVTIEELLHRHEEDTIIAQPGEPIISTRDACRKVNGYIGKEISLMMVGLEPALVFSEGRLVWRVPIALATPNRGPFGLIGALDVDTRTNDLIIPPHFVEEIETNARSLLASSPHPTEV